MNRVEQDKLKLVIRLSQKDNVATATEKLKKGEMVSVLSEEGKEIDTIQLSTDVPLPFHKIALVAIVKDEEVKKYGEVIGYASKSIDRGEWVHVHNIVSAGLPEEDIK